MSLKIAMVLLPDEFPMSTITLARARASFFFFIKAPFPTFTSSKILSAPAASFLLIMLLAIRDMLSTVAVTSLRA